MQESTPPCIESTVIVTFSEGSANYCSLSDKGTIAIATSSQGYAVVVDMSHPRNNIIALFDNHDSAVHQCAISAFGRAAATASLDGTVQIWNTENPRQIWKRLIYKDYDRALGVALSRNGEYLAAAFQRRSDEQGTIVVYKMPEFEEIAAWKIKALDVFSGAIAISSDGRIVVHCSTTKVYAVEVRAARELGVSRIGSHRSWRVNGESHVCMSADGSKIVVADNRSLRIISVTGSDIYELCGYQRSFRPFCCINAIGSRVVAAVDGNKFRIWELSGNIIADVVGFNQHTRGCSISENGNLILGCSFDGTVRLVNLEKDILSSPRHTEKEKEPFQFFDERHISNATNKKIPNDEVPDSRISHIVTEEKEEAPVFFVKEEVVEEQAPVELEETKDESGYINTDVEQKIDTEEIPQSSIVQNMIQRMEDLRKQMEEEELLINRPKKISETISIVDNGETKAKSQLASSNMANGAISVTAYQDTVFEHVLINPLEKSNEVFTNALFRNERSEERTLLHVQASEALHILFGDETLSELPKYAKDDILLDVDSARSWKINMQQFAEAVFKINREINASNTDRWTSAFTSAAESKENHLTLPQAAILISDVLQDDAPTRADVFKAIESASENEDEVSFKSFLASVKKLGFEE